MNAPVVLLIADDLIRPALYRWLMRWSELDLRIDDPEAGNVVVTTPRDCSLETCRELADLGCIVIVLAPVWRSLARKQYLQAGATEYMAMDLDSGRLAEVIREASGAGHVPGLTPNVAIG